MGDNPAAVKLREMIRNRDFVYAPGIWTPLEARIAEMTGNDVVYMSGAATNIAHYGFFDGLIGMREMADNAKRIATATDLPVVADADTGYGGVHNVQRTVREYDQAGAAALHIEDQEWPKRCGHAAGKVVVPRDDARARFQAAVDARDADDRDIVIIGRTDAYGSANADWEEHIARGRMFHEIGVDVIWPEMPDPGREDAIQYSEEVRETHPDITLGFNYSSSFNWSEEDDPLTFEELGDLGYNYIKITGFGLHAAAIALYEHMEALAEREEQAQRLVKQGFDGHEGFRQASDVIPELARTDEYREIERKYAAGD